MDTDKWNKKELVPIAALLLFIALVLILCAVSAGREADAQQSVSALREETQTGTQSTSAAPQEETQTGMQSAAPVSEREIGSGPAASDKAVQSGTEAAAEKTEAEMLAEMMDYWSKGNVEAVEDLSGLSRYRAMSAALGDPSHFFYYGERNEEGKPEGCGIAVYGEDQYYYGEWENGVRSGEGSWLKMYDYSDSDTGSDRTLISHSYTGSWQNDLPNGEGHEQYGLDIAQAEEGSRYLQNVMGNFRDGLYDGRMYLMTEDAGGNVQEWYGNASQGVFETFDGRDQEGRVPICQDAKDADSHLWIRPLDNLNLGIAELRAAHGE